MMLIKDVVIRMRILLSKPKTAEKKRRKNEAGFTLMEVLIALVILGVGFSILVQGYSLILTSLEKQRDYSYLTSWAEGKLIEAVNRVELAPRGYFVHKGKEFRWSIKQKGMDDGLREIILNVEWTGPNGLNFYRIERFNYSGK